MKDNWRKQFLWRCYLCGGPILNKKYLGKRKVGEVVLKLSMPQEKNQGKSILLVRSKTRRRK